MVEPKPYASLRLLLAELRAQRDAGGEAGGRLLPEEALGEPVAERAEELACALAARTDATLRWPASAILAAALRAALDERLGGRTRPEPPRGAQEGHGRDKS
ncbi:unnamed protein product [Prorocentrum cordatum]|uniref:Uncharacterized protein n=1 Tax=Prorocentrum cordatum TaxID=2364126 RepID=A0ABN9YF80_9DINO|nr:unnamed protein product [Polarella glacialis]